MESRNFWKSFSLSATRNLASALASVKVAVFSGFSRQSCQESAEETLGRLVGSTSRAGLLTDIFLTLCASG